MQKTWSYDDWSHYFRSKSVPAHAEGYHAMYSSEWEAIVTDPRCMQVPVDDHLVHRGDGVFETLLCWENGLYQLDAHLKRLRSSAEFIGIEAPSLDELHEIVLNTFRAAGKDRCLGRLLLGRGPGGFGVDPAESPVPSVYLVVYGNPVPFMEKNPEGARVIMSHQPVKPGGLARVKTCNYLPNAMMKAEATAAGVDFTVGVDPVGYLTESYTENIVLLDQDGVLRVPPADHHLPGTTLARVESLAKEAGMKLSDQPFTVDDAKNGRELMLVGTTAFVTSIVQFDGQAVSDGVPGPVARQLGELLEEDVSRNADLRTAF